ncbi:MarR family transcriptional regulator [Paenibacillus larvae]
MYSSSIFTKVSKIARSLDTGINRRLAPHGIYESQWVMLNAIHDLGPTTVTNLSNALIIKPPTVTKTINRLEKLGYVKRVTGKNKKEREIALTDLSREKLGFWNGLVKHYHESLLQSYSAEELRQLESLVDRFLLKAEELEDVTKEKDQYSNQN